MIGFSPGRESKVNRTSLRELEEMDVFRIDGKPLIASYFGMRILEKEGKSTAPVDCPEIIAVQSVIVILQLQLLSSPNFFQPFQLGQWTE